MPAGAAAAVKAGTKRLGSKDVNSVLLHAATRYNPKRRVTPKSSPSSLCRINPEKELPREKTFTMTSLGLGDGSLNKGGLSLEMEDSSLSSTTEAPFFREEQNTFRDQLKSAPESIPYRINETPQKMESDPGDSLKKYIQMLLERPPGLPVDEALDKSSVDSTLLNISEACNVLRWQQVLSERSRQQIKKSTRGKKD